MPVKKLVDDRLQKAKEESFSLKGGFLFLSAASTNFEDPESRTWQFRVSVHPTRDNLFKALQALMNMDVSSFPNIPTMKLYAPDPDINKEYWNATCFPPEGFQAADRDQRGKEICVYMDYDPYTTRYLLSPDEYKKFMLQIWKTLETEGVELSYVTPRHDEREISTETYVLTPFCYSAYKPFKQKEGVDHGILHAGSYNPKKFPDPLEGVFIYKEDLRAFQIKQYDAFSISAKRIYNHTANLQRAYAEIAAKIAEIMSAPPVDLKSSSEHFPAFATAALHPIEDHPFFKAIDHDFARPDGSKSVEKTEGEAVPRRAAEGQEIESLNRDELARLTNFDDPCRDLVDKMLGSELFRANPIASLSNITGSIALSLQEKMQQEFSALCPLLISVAATTLCVESFLWAIGRNPRLMQDVYRVLVHCAHEQQALEREKERCAIARRGYPDGYERMWAAGGATSFERAKAILNNYTKDDSAWRLFFTGHPKRHHTQAVAQILANDTIVTLDQLLGALAKIDIPHEYGSLQCRINFILGNKYWEEAAGMVAPPQMEPPPGVGLHV